MDESKTVSLSPAEAEEFWAGPDARSIAPEATPATPEYAAQCPELRDPVVDDLRAAFLHAELNQSCCVGVDLPEAGGHVHSEHCPHAGSPVRSGRGNGAGEVPQSRDRAGDVKDERDALLVELVFAAKELANSNVYDPWPDGLGGRENIGCVGCRECGQLVQLRSRSHLPGCKVGRVLSVIDRLLALPFHPSRKEAPEGEIRAEAGNPSRGADSALAQADGCGSLIDRTDAFEERQDAERARLAAPVVSNRARAWDGFARMDEAVAFAKDTQYIAFGRSVATGTDLYFVFDHVDQIAGREMVIMQRPKGGAQ